MDAHRFSRLWIYSLFILPPHDGETAKAADQYLFTPGKTRFYRLKYQVYNLLGFGVRHSSVSFIHIFADIVFVHGKRAPGDPAASICGEGFAAVEYGSAPQKNQTARATD